MKYRVKSISNLAQSQRKMAMKGKGRKSRKK